MALTPNSAMQAIARQAGYPKLPHFVDQMDATARFTALMGAWAGAQATVDAMAGRHLQASDMSAAAVASQFVDAYNAALAQAGSIMADLAQGPVGVANAIFELASIDMLVAFLEASFIAADWGRMVHQPDNAIALVQSGKATEAELTDDFQMRLSVFQALIDFGETTTGKALIATRPGAAGLGIAPVIVAILAVAAIIAVALLVYGAILMINNKRWNDRCDAGLQAQEAWALQACPQGDPNLRAIAEAGASATSSITSSIVKYGLLGAAVVGGVMFLPQIVESVKNAVAKARS